MQLSDRGAFALRLSALLLLAAIALGLLVSYGAGSSVAAVLPVAVLAGPVGYAVATAPDVAAVPLAHHRAPWEAYYMYGVSAAAGCWVLARLASQWQFDPRRLAIRPRSDAADVPVASQSGPERADEDAASSLGAHDASPHVGGSPSSLFVELPALPPDRPAALTAGGPADGRRRLPPGPTSPTDARAAGGGRAVPDGGDRSA